jgi:hypothetical protein
MSGTAGPTLAQLTPLQIGVMVRRFGVPKQLMNQTRNPDVMAALFAPRAERRGSELDRSSASGIGAAHVGKDQM